MHASRVWPVWMTERVVVVESSSCSTKKVQNISSSLLPLPRFVKVGAHLLVVCRRGLAFLGFGVD